MSHTIIRIDSAPVRLGLFAAQGPAGLAGPAGPNVVNVSTVSNGTANLSVSNLTTVTGSVSGILNVPTATTATSTLQVASTAFVQQELAAGTAVAKNLEVYVRNMTGAALTAGTIVYINGTNGNRPTITKARANSDANSAQTFGFTKTALADNAFGYVIVRGEVENINTHGLGGGTQLYLSPSVAGEWTTTKPVAPNHLVYVGIVIKDHPTQGVILVAIQNGYELNELHDVLITTPAAKQVVKRNAGNTLWINEAIVSADVSDATSAASASTIVLRTSGGAASFTGITNNGLLTLSTGTTFSYGAGIAAAHRTALGLGTLATQNGNFSGTSSGTNTGDQDLSGLLLSTIAVSNVLDPNSNPITLNLIEQATLSNGKRKWVTADLSGSLEGAPGVWTLSTNEGYEATISSPSDAPWMLTGWTVNTGSGQPSFTIDPTALLPVNGASGTIALSTDQQGRVAPADMTGLGSGVATALALAANAANGFPTANSAGRTALGSGATGDAIFTAATPAAARTVLEINRTRVTQATDLSNATTTFADTDLVLTLQGGVDYLIRGQFDLVSTAAGTGFKLQLLTSQNVNALATTANCLGWVAIGGAVSIINSTTLTTADFLNFTGSSTRRAQAEIRINLVATGTTRIRFAQNAGNTAPASVFKAGSFWTSEIL